MAYFPPEHRDGIGADLSLGLHAFYHRVTPKARRGKENTWNLWCFFLQSVGIKDPYLSDYPFDILDLFIVFGLRYRRGALGKDQKGRPTTSSKPVRGETVSTALQAVGERFTDLGGSDPRLLREATLAPRLKNLYTFFRNEDPPSSRLWPVTLTIIKSLEFILSTLADKEFAGAVLDLTTIGFFFMCRPGEYALSKAGDEGRSSPFRLQDVKFASRSKQNLDATTAPLNDVTEAVFTALTFTDQKNAVRDETIGHHCNGDAIFNPVRATVRRVQHLRRHGAPPDTPLHDYYDPKTKKFKSVTTGNVTNLLKTAAGAVEHLTGIPPSRIQAYSLRSGGATALLCANVSTEKIQLLGRWKSDAMFRYLRTQAAASTESLSTHMLQHGAYTFNAQKPDVDLFPSNTPSELINLVSITPPAEIEAAGLL